MSSVESPVIGHACLIIIFQVLIHIKLTQCIVQEGSGFVAVKTGNLMLFGSYSSSMYPSVCVEAVEKLGKL